jgi:hypothetical protein
VAQGENPEFKPQHRLIGKVQKERSFRVENMVAMEFSLHTFHRPSVTHGRPGPGKLNVLELLPVAHAGAKHSGNDAEGEDMQCIGQQHLPLLVQAVLTLLVADSSKHRNWHGRQVPKQTVTTQLRDGRLAQAEL